MPGAIFKALHSAAGACGRSEPPQSQNGIFYKVQSEGASSEWHPYPQARQIVIKDTEGRLQCLKLDDSVAGLDGDGRDWYRLWEEGAARMDLSSGACRDLFNQVVARGEAVKGAMVAAEDAARKGDVSPGEARDVRRRHSKWSRRTSATRGTPT